MSKSDYLFQTYERESDPEGYISKFVAYEYHRLLRGYHGLDISGTESDRLDVFYWYLTSYNSHRNNAFRLPISSNQKNLFNKSPVMAGLKWPLSTGILAFIMRERPDLRDLYNDNVARKALHWWCIARAPGLKVENVLVTSEQVNYLRRIGGHWSQVKYGLNYFAEEIFNSNTKFHCLDMGSERDRLIFFSYLAFFALNNPHLLRFLPDECHSMLNYDSSKFESGLFEHLIGSFSSQHRGDTAQAKLLLAGAKDLIQSRGYSSKQPYGPLEGSARNYGECFNIKIAKSKHKMEGINVIGPIDVASGLGQATRLSYNIVSAIEKHAPGAINFDLDNPAPVGYSTSLARSQVAHPRKINLFHLNAESIPLAFAYLSSDLYNNSYNIGYFFWELDKIPECHNLALDLLDEIWVSSEYNKEIYSPLTRIPVINVGMAAESLEFEGKASLEEYGANENDCVFLTTFDSFSFVERKNPLAVINAFRKAFTLGQSDVKLIIKTQNRQKVQDPYQKMMWQRISKITEADPRIIIIDRTMKYADLIKLKSSVSAYVSLHRSEGWGFGMIEAMQLGIPVICTAYSGNMDFCNSDNSFLVDYELINPFPEEYIFVPRGSRWADPSVTSASAAMYNVYINRAQAAEIGRCGKKYIEANFSIPAISKRYEDRISHIRRNLISRAE